MDEARAAQVLDQREYTLWRALQIAPMPRYKGVTGHLYGKQMNWEDMDWLREYERWFSGPRLTAMKDAPLGSLGIQLLEKQVENDRLRELLREARDALDNFRLVQQIDEAIGALENDIEL